MAFGTDHASVMVGPRNSVPYCFEAEQPLIFHILCTCYIAVFCAADACKAILKTVEQLCRDILYITTLQIVANVYSCIMNFKNFLR